MGGISYRVRGQSGIRLSAGNAVLPVAAASVDASSRLLINPSSLLPLPGSIRSHRLPGRHVGWQGCGYRVPGSRAEAPGVHITQR